MWQEVKPKQNKWFRRSQWGSWGRVGQGQPGFPLCGGSHWEPVPAHPLAADGIWQGRSSCSLAPDECPKEGASRTPSLPPDTSTCHLWHKSFLPCNCCSKTGQLNPFVLDLPLYHSEWFRGDAAWMEDSVCRNIHARLAAWISSRTVVLHYTG